MYPGIEITTRPLKISDIMRMYIVRNTIVCFLPWGNNKNSINYNSTSSETYSVLFTVKKSDVIDINIKWHTV